MTTIKQISTELGVSAHAIRTFDERSIDRLKAIIHYRRVGMSLEDIRRILAEFHNHQLSTELLEKPQLALEAQIAELQETHAYLIEKIKIHRHLAEMEAKGMTADDRTTAYYDIRRQQAD